MSRTMPIQKPGKSKQDYGTPRTLLKAVMRRLGIASFECDLAAHAKNCIPFTDRYFGPGSDEHEDSLDKQVRWASGTSWCWLNPPFGNIGPWVRKANRESRKYGSRIAVLVPLSIADWWNDYVHGDCIVLMLKPRVTFIGADQGYPKDCAVLLYGSGLPANYYVWDWSQTARNVRANV